MTSQPSEISSSCVTTERLTQMMERTGEVAQRWAEFRRESVKRVTKFSTPTKKVHKLLTVLTFVFYFINLTTFFK